MKYKLCIWLFYFIFVCGFMFLKPDKSLYLMQMLISFCLLEESSIGPETERSTSLAYILIVFSGLFKEPIKIKAILIGLVKIKESLLVRYSLKQQALDVKELLNLFPILVVCCMSSLVFCVITALFLCGKNLHAFGLHSHYHNKQRCFLFERLFQTQVMILNVCFF